jgi:serine/threonine protein kinase
LAERSGQRLGNYQLIRLLGEGGFAKVYLGEHVYLKNLAAIKVLGAQLMQGEAEAFQAEARILIDLKHPSIIRVLEFGIEENVPFLIMEYAANGTLRQRHPKGTRVPPETIARYVKQLASALQYAHDHKLIHRDIKPENMLLQSDNELLLSDFGIAMIAQTTHLQGGQEIGGTAPYMAPEQVQGYAQFASDQYALGIVVYEWLSGRPPFLGSFSEVFAQHIFASPPPLHEKLPLISPEIEHVVMTALAKDPQQRFVNVQSFADALEQAILSASAEPAATIRPASSIRIGSSQYVQPQIAPSPQPQIAPAYATPPLLTRDSSEANYAPTIAYPGHTLQSQPSRPKRRAGRIFALFVALLVLLGGSGVFYAVIYQPNHRRELATASTLATEKLATVQARATARAEATTQFQATATVQAKTPEGLYTLATSGTPVLNAPLKKQDDNNWNTDDEKFCSFSKGAYHITDPTTGTFMACMAQKTDFSNFAFEVEMTIIKGDGGGLIFRDNDDKAYRFRISPDGSYDLAGLESGKPLDGTSVAIHTGENQMNRLTVIAQGTTIYLYANKQFIGKINDGNSSKGRIGFFALNFGNPAEVMFSNAKLWQL